MNFVNPMVHESVPPSCIVPAAPATPGIPTGFSAGKRAILLFLKRSPSSSLVKVAGALGVSRAAAWKHLAELEGRGLVEREYQHGRRGRPFAVYFLSADSQRIFPEAYRQMSLSALDFLERRHGRRAVLEMLQERASELRTRHSRRLAGLDLVGRTRELARIRDEEGYMASAGRPTKGGQAILEHNCPIVAIAERYGEACDVERRLFRDLLDADVRVSHRVVAGDPVCRFWVRGRPGELGCR